MNLGPPHGPTGPIAVASTVLTLRKGPPPLPPFTCRLKTLLPLSPHQNFQPKDLCSLRGGQSTA